MTDLSALTEGDNTERINRLRQVREAVRFIEHIRAQSVAARAHSLAPAECFDVLDRSLDLARDFLQDGGPVTLVNQSLSPDPAARVLDSFTESVASRDLPMDLPSDVEPVELQGHIEHAVIEISRGIVEKIRPLIQLILSMSAPTPDPVPDEIAALIDTVRRLDRDALQVSGAIELLREDVSNRRIAEQSRRAERIGAKLDELQEVVADKTEVAGEVAEGRLAVEFGSILKSEKTQADRYRRYTIWLGSGAIAYSGFVAWHSHGDSGSILQKLAVTIPALLLAAYLGREAGEHRRSARWAGVLTTQLRSIEFYTPQLSSESAEKLKAAFGHRVFSETGQTHSSQPADQLTIEQIIELARLLR